MPDLLATDGLTYVLGFTAAVAFLIHTYLTPQSLVHPILLGRQSDVERIRQKGESAVYRNYGTGIVGRLPLRPDNNIQKVWDLVKPDFTESRALWSTKITNDALRSRVSALGSALVRVAGLQPKESNVLLLLNDGLDFLVADLALASQAIPSFTLSSLTLLSAVLDSHPPSAIIVHVNFAHTVLELIAENREYAHHTIILVGEGDVPKALEKVQVKALWLSDLERQGAREEGVQYAQSEPDDVVSVAFYPGPNNELKAAQLTHQNLTAGVAAVRGLFPLNGNITPADSIVSSHSLSTPFGRVVAYTAVYEGANFATSESTTIYKTDEVSQKSDAEVLTSIQSVQPPPTILFMTPSQLHAIVSPIITTARKSLLFPLSWRHKVFHLHNGFLSNDSMWDRLVFTNARKSVLKGITRSLRSVIISGGVLEATALTPTRVALSIPIVNAHTHPLVAGPVFFSHPLDFQSFPSSSTQGEFTNIAPVGPPSINIEVKLTNVNDDAIEGGADPSGEIVIRGPSVTLPLDGVSKPHDWVRTGERGLVQTNGSFKVIPAPKLAPSHV